MPMTFSNRAPDFFKPHDVIDLAMAASRISEYTQATLDTFFGGVAPSGGFGPSGYLIELLDPAVVNDITDETMNTVLSVVTMGFTVASAAFASGSSSGVPKFGIQSVVEGIEEFDATVETGAVTSGVDVLIVEVDEENFLGIETGGGNPGTIIGDYNGPTPFFLYEPPEDNDIQDELDDEITDPPSVYVLAGVRIKSTNAVDGQTVTSPVTVTTRIFLAVRDV